MASLIYIPTDDPFAILGIILLFVLLLTALVLLVITARRSAMNVRNAVRNEAQYQRLQQSAQREERRALQNLGKGKRKAKENVSSTPMIVLKTASTAHSMRSGSARDSRTFVPTKDDQRLAERCPSTVDDDLSTATRSLLNNTGGPSESSKGGDDILPKTLRLGQPYGQFRCVSAYKSIARHDPDTGEKKV